eukprot:scaffold251527_cov30-Tisochrysis_lutea.AAC.4
MSVSASRSSGIRFLRYLGRVAIASPSPSSPLRWSRMSRRALSALASACAFGMLSASNGTTTHIERGTSSNTLPGPTFRLVTHSSPLPVLSTDKRAMTTGGVGSLDNISAAASSRLSARRIAQLCSLHISNLSSSSLPGDAQMRHLRPCSAIAPRS